MVNKVLELIRQVYCKEYTGRLEVEKLPIGYAVKIWLDRNTPTMIAAEIEDPDKFLEYIKEELKNSRWHYTKYTKISYDPR